jgi:hypothetical protein
MSPIAPVSKLEIKSHDAPDEVRTPEKTRVELVNVGGYTIGRFTFDRGWRWSECIKPVVKTELCQLNHVGYCISGAMTIEVGGEVVKIKAGDSYSIPPGHDGWVDDEPFVGLEIVSAAEYAKA